MLEINKLTIAVNQRFLVKNLSLVLNKNDKIVVYINKDVDVNRTYELTKYIQNQFPDNQVIVIHNLFIDGIDILKERTEFDELLQPFEDCLNS